MPDQLNTPPTETDALTKALGMSTMRAGAIEALQHTAFIAANPDVRIIRELAVMAGIELGGIGDEDFTKEVVHRASSLTPTRDPWLDRFGRQTPLIAAA